MDYAKKNKLKITLKTIFEVFFCVFCIFFLVFSPKFIFNEENYALDINKFLTSEKKSKIVLTIHHVETFEGGSRSRSQFLENEAMLFNKKYPHIFISVITLTPQQLFLNLADGNLPDIYSFGTGVGEYIGGHLLSLDWDKNIRDDKKSYCTLGGKVLCYPYIQSGYFLITNENLLKNSKKIANFDEISLNSRLQSVIKGKNIVNGLSVGMDYTSPTSAIRDLRASKDDCVVFHSPYKAYCNFVEGGSVSLLGTMRDVIRCKNREMNGKMSSCIYTPLGSFSDLVQYVGVVDKPNLITCGASKLFASYLVSENPQSHLADYGLFSCSEKNIYIDEPMASIEREFSITQSLSAFTPLAEIESKRAGELSKIFPAS